jgi:hypothetical protein
MATIAVMAARRDMDPPGRSSRYKYPSVVAVAEVAGP